MAKSKEERNTGFIQDWKEDLNDKELGKKHNLKIGEVKGSKARDRQNRAKLGFMLIDQKKDAHRGSYRHFKG